MLPNVIFSTGRRSVGRHQKTDYQNPIPLPHKPSPLPQNTPITPTVFWLQTMVARGSGSCWPPAPHHPHIALGVLLQNVGRLGVPSEPVCRSSRHSARTHTGHTGASPALSSALHPSSVRIRVGWGAGRDAAVHGGPWGRSPSSIATGTLHVMESFPLGLRSSQPYSHGHK